MNINILKGFITRLDFISDRTRYAYNNDFELNILNVDNEKNKINGSATIRLGIDDTEVIVFEIQFNKSDDILIFKSKYQNVNNRAKRNPHFMDEGEHTVKTESNLFEEVDTFAIIEQEKKVFFTPKTKYLIHLVNGNIKQAYTVSKKYKFENGVSENFTKLNMNNKDVVNSINTSYETQSKKR